MTLETLLATLSPAEKLTAMDILWRDLSANPAELPSPAWHARILSERGADPSSRPSLPLQAAMEDVRNRIDARRTQG
ncbi:MAG: addiction module protein [Planctomycetales bacterium]|nr:addiction module protein [Planctomycetales bacterium]MCA9162720.1 addiction module protein [Planctomycetales bacterium]MCA9205354.1 addiction module protein [Planctomycetales bacterium]MCA9211282.1 addiction module protein [Planctomycetales bacterium]MCA9219434.1 addiction module protein [Planctomycetales bacterium]